MITRMMQDFSAAPNPTLEALANMVAADPTNPFFTAGYIRARAALGETAWLTWLGDDAAEGAEVVCPAFLSAGKVRRRLELPSLPDIAASSSFWTGLADLCAQQRITDLTINTFASRRADIPAIAREQWRKARFEYVLDVQRDPLWSGISANHRRNIRRGEKSGLEISRRTTVEACIDHTALMGTSMQRRRLRGEDAPTDQNHDRLARFLEYGAGELFQAALDDEVLSSALVLQSPTGSYYQSAGTNPAEMSKGASHFLIARVAETLRDEGKSVFNLGGADADQAGLTRFKSGFASRRVDLEAAAFDTARPWQRAASAGVDAIRRLVAHIRSAETIPTVDRTRN